MRIKEGELVQVVPATRVLLLEAKPIADPVYRNPQGDDVETILDLAGQADRRNRWPLKRVTLYETRNC
jgi:hypothetical protein